MLKHDYRDRVTPEEADESARDVVATGVAMCAAAVALVFLGVSVAMALRAFHAERQHVEILDTSKQAHSAGRSRTMLPPSSGGKDSEAEK